METLPLRMGDVPFAHGNASFTGGGRAFFGWKRRCTNFRAVYRRKGARRRTKTENTSRNAYFRRGFSAEYAKKMAFLAFGLRNPTFFYYFCG